MTMRCSRRVLHACSVAILLLTVFSSSSASPSCHSYAGDTLLRRIDDHLATCLPSTPSTALDAFRDALLTNELELDETQRKPLAVVAIASSAAVLDRFAAAVATAVAGDAPGAHAVHVLDLQAAAAARQSTYEITQALRHDMAMALAACPLQRTLFLVRGVEHVRGDQLPLLDVFLDPLNGVRATLHDAVTGRDLDSRRARFVFLYQRDQSDVVGTTAAAWREFLVTKWRVASAEGTLATDAFTPQALAGRLTTAVVLDNGDQNQEQDGAKRQLSNACALEVFLSRLQAARRPATGLWSDSVQLATSPSHVASLVGVVLVAVGLVLTSAKSFVAHSKLKAVEVEGIKATKSKRRQQQRHKKKRLSHAHLEPDTERLASLRSHSHSSHEEASAAATVATSVTATATVAAAAVSLAPASPVLAPASAAAERKTASPDPKTPTPTKPTRTGRGRRASTGPTTTTTTTTRQSRHT